MTLQTFMRAFGVTQNSPVAMKEVSLWQQKRAGTSVFAKAGFVFVLLADLVDM